MSLTWMLDPLCSRMTLKFKVWISLNVPIVNSWLTDNNRMVLSTAEGEPGPLWIWLESNFHEKFESSFKTVSITFSNQTFRLHNGVRVGVRIASDEIGRLWGRFWRCSVGVKVDEDKLHPHTVSAIRSRSLFPTIPSHSSMKSLQF